MFLLPGAMASRSHASGNLALPANTGPASVANAANTGPAPGANAANTGPAPGANTGLARKRGKRQTCPPAAAAAGVPHNHGPAAAGAAADEGPEAALRIKRGKTAEWKKNKRIEVMKEYNRSANLRRLSDQRAELQARQYNESGLARTRDWMIKSD